MDKATAALVDIAAALDIELTGKEDTKSLKLKILAGIDRLEYKSQCREKDYKKAAQRSGRWRSVAKSFQTASVAHD